MARARARVARGRILMRWWLWKIPSQTDFDFASKKCASTVLMPVHVHCQFIGISAKLELLEIDYLFLSPIHIRSVSTKRRRKGTRNKTAFQIAIILGVVHSISSLNSIASRRRVLLQSDEKIMPKYIVSQK